MKYFAIIFGSLLLVACANTGNESMKGMTEDKAQATIVEGKTTKAQIKGMFGSPLRLHIPTAVL